MHRTHVFKPLLKPFVAVAAAFALAGCLTESEIDDLVSFLEALTDSGFLASSRP